MDTELSDDAAQFFADADRGPAGPGRGGPRLRSDRLAGALDASLQGFPDQPEQIIAGEMAELALLDAPGRP